MIVDSQQDFFGGYDHAARAGFVHWAERRLSPGKKQWTWGDAPFGRAWDAQLTDDDGPYVELMAGVYTDNQPDFSWLMPGETKTFSQYWYPIPAIGVAHQASPDAAVHVERNGRIAASFAVTRPQPGAVLRILQDGREAASRTSDLTPGQAMSIESPDFGGEDVAVELRSSGGQLLVRWEPTQAVGDQEPWVADEPAPPHAIDTIEELYLTGLHLAQYRHPTRSPLPYWREALVRDPGDARTNLALADHLYRAGRYEDARERVTAALARLTRRNAQPQDAEVFHLLGLVLRRLGRATEAEQALGKAGWDGSWAAASGFVLAQSLSRRGRDRAAMRVLDSIDQVVAHDARRAALRVVLLRRAGEEEAAREVIVQALAQDPLDATLRILAGTAEPDDAGILFDSALELRDAGAGQLALDILARVTASPVTPSGNLRPVAHYAASAILDELGRHEDAETRRSLARASELTWAFPHGLDAHDILRTAITADADDGVAHHLFGMLLYAHGRRREAAEHWDRAIRLGLRDRVLLRNAALAAYNIAHDDARAWELYEEAVEVAPADARLLYEQDQLAVRLGHSPQQRFTRLSPLRDLVLERDDFTIEYVSLLVEIGLAADAHDIL